MYGKSIRIQRVNKFMFIQTENSEVLKTIQAKTQLTNEPAEVLVLIPNTHTVKHLYLASILIWRYWQ